jgi:hypothetical protein
MTAIDLDYLASMGFDSPSERVIDNTGDYIPETIFTGGPITVAPLEERDPITVRCSTRFIARHSLAFLARIEKEWDEIFAIKPDMLSITRDVARGE